MVSPKLWKMQKVQSTPKGWNSLEEGSSCVQILRELPEITKSSSQLVEEEEGEADHINGDKGARHSTETAAGAVKGAECTREAESAGVVNETRKGGRVANLAFSACRGPSLSNRLWTSLSVILH